MTASISFRDLELEVSLAADGSRRVRVLDYRGPEAPFSLPEDLTPSTELLKQIDARFGKGESPELPFPDIGSALFTGLFSGTVEERFRSLSEAPGDGSVRLRLSFEGGAEAGERPEAADLPWEGLVDPRTGQSLFSAGIPLVRYLDMPVGVRRFEVRPPLRVLLVAAEPPHYRKGEAVRHSTVHEERDLVRAVLKESPHFEVEDLSPPTFDEVQKRLARGGFHVLHFIGHGNFSRKHGMGGLVFEDVGGAEQGRTVWAHQFGEVVGGNSSLRLVVLNSCRSGMMAGQEGFDPLEGFAAALLSKGLPSVLAMRFSIRQSAAKVYASAFYDALVETGQVDAAAVAATAALYEDATEREAQQWLIPALFSRAAHGRIFDLGPAPAHPPPTRIGLRSFFGWGTSIEEWSDHFLPLTVYFRGREPKPEVDWQGTLYPRLTSFLEDATAGQGRLHLDFAAHCSLAFAAGHYLEAKSGHGYVVRQRGFQGIEDWALEGPSEGQSYPGWRLTEHAVAGGGEDVALAVSATNPTIEDVKAYVQASLPSVGTIVEAVVENGASHVSVQDGAHAFALATELRGLLSRRPGNWGGTFHLFFAGPNALMFTLGCLCRGPFRIQLYEFDFDGKCNRSYTPSLRFPPP